MRIVHCIQEPLDIFLTSDDSRKSEDRERRIVRMHTHIDAVFFAHRHYCGKEVPHILTKLIACDSVILFQETAEDTYRINIPFFDVTIHESLGLDYDRVYQVIFLIISHHLVQFLHLCKDIF